MCVDGLASQQHRKHFLRSQTYLLSYPDWKKSLHKTLKWLNISLLLCKIKPVHIKLLKNVEKIYLRRWTASLAIAHLQKMPCFNMFVGQCCSPTYGPAVLHLKFQQLTCRIESGWWMTTVSCARFEPHCRKLHKHAKRWNTSCKKPCTTDKCTCKTYNLPCTDLCCCQGQ